MKIKEAVAQRIMNLCKERNIAINALGNISGVNPSTIYSMLNTKSQNPGVVSLQKICDYLVLWFLMVLFLLVLISAYSERNHNFQISVIFLLLAILIDLLFQ